MRRRDDGPLLGPGRWRRVATDHGVEYMWHRRSGMVCWVVPDACDSKAAVSSTGVLSRPVPAPALSMVSPPRGRPAGSKLLLPEHPPLPRRVVAYGLESDGRLGPRAVELAMVAVIKIDIAANGGAGGGGGAGVAARAGGTPRSPRSNTPRSQRGGGRRRSISSQSSNGGTPRGLRKNSGGGVAVAAAGGRNGTRPIEQKLMSWKGERAARHAALAAKHAPTFAPRLNARAASPSPRGAEAEVASQRLFRHHATVLAKVERRQAAKLEAEVAGLFVPRVQPSRSTAVSKQLSTVTALGADGMLAWEAKRRQRLEALRRAKREAEARDHTFIPKINSKSSRGTGASPRANDTEEAGDVIARFDEWGAGRVRGGGWPSVRSTPVFHQTHRQPCISSANAPCCASSSNHM